MSSFPKSDTTEFGLSLGQIGQLFLNGILLLKEVVFLAKFDFHQAEKCGIVSLEMVDNLNDAN